MQRVARFKCLFVMQVVILVVMMENEEAATPGRTRRKNKEDGSSVASVCGNLPSRTEACLPVFVPSLGSGASAVCYDVERSYRACEAAKRRRFFFCPLTTAVLLGFLAMQVVLL